MTLNLTIARSIVSAVTESDRTFIVSTYIPLKDVTANSKNL
ncbi:hypothetical protein QUB60_13935 [Microcoleus sp. A2-C5]|nr:hypothetical protein [Lyngbya sp. CCAP 1446/10]